MLSDERSTAPTIERPIAAKVTAEPRSRKKQTMASATASGYMKWMIEATPLAIIW